MGTADKTNGQDLKSGTDCGRGRLLNGALAYAFLITASAVLGMSVVRMSATTAIVAAASVVLIWLLVQWIEIPFYFAVFAILALQEVEITQGSLLSIFENYKSPGVPSLLEISIVLLGVCFLTKYSLRKEEPAFSLFRTPVVLFLILYCVSLYMGYCAGANDILFKEDTKRFAFPILFFLCSLNILTTVKRINHLVTLVLLVSAAKVYLGILSYLHGAGFDYGDSRVVFVETADLILVVTVLVALVSRMVYGRVTWKMLLLVLLLGAPLMFSLVYSNRRNAWLGILLALALLFFVTPAKTKFRMALILLCAGLAGVAMISVSMALRSLPSGQDLKSRFASISDKGDKSNEAHVNEWIVTIEALEEHPIWGLGFGSEHAPVPGDDTINRHTVHNAFLMLYMKMGVLAVALFLWCLVRYFRFAISHTHAGASGELGALRVGLFSTFAYWLVTLNVAPSWWYYRETCMMALVSALVIQLSTMQEAGIDLDLPRLGSGRNGVPGP